MFTAPRSVIVSPNVQHGAASSGFTGYNAVYQRESDTDRSTLQMIVSLQLCKIEVWGVRDIVYEAFTCMIMLLGVEGLMALCVTPHVIRYSSCHRSCVVRSQALRRTGISIFVKGHVKLMTIS